MLAALPTLVTWAVEFVGLMPFSNLTRFVAGVPLGIAAAWLVFAELNPRPAPAPRGPQPA